MSQATIRLISLVHGILSLWVCSSLGSTPSTPNQEWTRVEAEEVKPGRGQRSKAPNSDAPSRSIKVEILGETITFSDGNDNRFLDEFYEDYVQLGEDGPRILQNGFVQLDSQLVELRIAWDLKSVRFREVLPQKDSRSLKELFLLSTGCAAPLECPR